MPSEADHQQAARLTTVDCQLTRHLYEKQTYVDFKLGTHLHHRLLLWRFEKVDMTRTVNGVQLFSSNSIQQSGITRP